MAAIRYEVFDDLLIGNFMKTTLLGRWPGSRLHPFFTPVVAKYADNGRAFSSAELDSYFHAYRSREPFEFMMHRLQHKSVQMFRNFVSPQSRAGAFLHPGFSAMRRPGMTACAVT